MSTNFTNMLQYLSTPVLLAMRHDLRVQHMNLSAKTNVYEYKLSLTNFEKHVAKVDELEEQLKKLDKEINKRKTPSR